jgi:hypothetical protein
MSIACTASKGDPLQINIDGPKEKQAATLQVNIDGEKERKPVTLQEPLSLKQSLGLKATIAN